MTLINVIILILLGSLLVWRPKESIWNNLLYYFIAVFVMSVITIIAYGVMTQHPDVPISSGVYIHK